MLGIRRIVEGIALHSAAVLAAIVSRDPLESMIAPAGAHLGEESQDVGASHFGKEPRFTRQIGRSAADGERVARAVVAVDFRRAGGGPQIAEQEAQECGLSRAVRPKQTEHFAARNRERAIVERPRGP